MSCPEVFLRTTDCPCIIELTCSGLWSEFNLSEATIQETNNAIILYGPYNSKKEWRLSKEHYTLEQIKSLRDSCKDENTLSADEIPTYELKCGEDGQLVYCDLSQSPPASFTFDGQPYVGNLVSCEKDYVKTDQQLCDPDGNIVVKVTCVNKRDINDVSMFWITNDSVTDVEPLGLGECDACEPFSVSDWYSNLTNNEEQFNRIAIHNPTCCDLVLTLTSGSHIIPMKTEDYTLDFDCLIGPSFSIDTDGCNAEEILVTLIRTK